MSKQQIYCVWIPERQSIVNNGVFTDSRRAADRIRDCYTSVAVITIDIAAAAVEDYRITSGTEFWDRLATKLSSGTGSTPPMRSSASRLGRRRFRGRERRMF